MKLAALLLTFIATGCVPGGTKPPSTPSNDTSPSLEETGSPAAVAKAFYAEVRRTTIHGLPDEKQMQRLSKSLTPGLIQLFHDARAEQREFIRDNPDEKPPWIEGDLFSSLFEGVEKSRMGEVQQVGEQATAKVHLSYNGGLTETVNWTDTLVLVLTQEGWKVDDIRLEGDWAFKYGTTLRGILSARD